MALNTETSTWQSLAEQATLEMDGQKLSALVARLCAAIDAKDRGLSAHEQSPCPAPIALS